jgi:hypothetical protein
LPASSGWISPSRPARRRTEAGRCNPIHITPHTSLRIRDGVAVHLNSTGKRSNLPPPPSPRSSTYGLGLGLCLGVVRAASRRGGGLDLVGRVVARRRPGLPTRRGQLIDTTRGDRGSADAGEGGSVGMAQKQKGFGRMPPVQPYSLCPPTSLSAPSS